MDVVVRLLSAEQRSGRGLALLIPVVPVLHAHAAEDRMQVIRHIAGREHVRQRCPASRVHEHAVVDPGPRRRQQLAVGHDPDPGHHHVALEDAPLLGAHPFDSSGAFERLHRVFRDQLHSLVAMDASQHAPDLLAQNARQRHAGALDGGHLDAELAERGRDLGADEAEPHHDRATSGPDDGADAVAVLDRA